MSLSIIFRLQNYEKYPRRNNTILSDTYICTFPPTIFKLYLSIKQSHTPKSYNPIEKIPSGALCSSLALRETAVDLDQLLMMLIDVAEDFR